MLSESLHYQDMYHQQIYAGSQSNNNPQENSLTVKDGAAAAMEASYIAAVERPITTDTALRNAELVREAEEKRRRIEQEKRSQWEKELEMERQLQRSMRQSM